MNRNISNTIFLLVLMTIGAYSNFYAQNKTATINRSLLKSGSAVKPKPIAKQFLQTELFFGTNKPDGTAVSEEDWKQFLAEEVTPKFPDGFTIIPGYGQFREANGSITRENSYILIVLYPFQTRKISQRKIEQIRAAYKKNFQQQSVLRVDLPIPLRIFF
jgi:hypothetical protein